MRLRKSQSDLGGVRDGRFASVIPTNVKRSSPPDFRLPLEQREPRRRRSVLFDVTDDASWEVMGGERDLERLAVRRAGTPGDDELERRILGKIERHEGGCESARGSIDECPVGFERGPSALGEIAS